MESVSAPDELILTDHDLNEETLINRFKVETVDPIDVAVDNNGTSRAVDNRVFLNPSTQDTLLSNLIKSNNITAKPVAKNGKNREDGTISLSSAPVASKNMAIATRDNNVCDVIKR